MEPAPKSGRALRVVAKSDPPPKPARTSKSVATAKSEPPPPPEAAPKSARTPRMSWRAAARVALARLSG